MKHMTSIAMLSMALLGAGVTTAAQAAQSISFIEPVNGAVVSSPFNVKFGAAGVEVKPAGEIIPNTGHHHLLINAEDLKKDESIPFDEKHLHFGKGQTETMVTLPPGNYTLTLQFGNGAHQSYGQDLSKSINVTVK
jgi:Domain of unknown function (DUF4399)